MRLFPHEGRKETAAATRNRIPRPALRRTKKRRAACRRRLSSPSKKI